MSDGDIAYLKVCCTCENMVVMWKTDVHVPEPGSLGHREDCFMQIVDVRLRDDKDVGPFWAGYFDDGTYVDLECLDPTQLVVAQRVEYQWEEY